VPIASNAIAAALERKKEKTSEANGGVSASVEKEHKQVAPWRQTHERHAVPEKEAIRRAMLSLFCPSPPPQSFLSLFPFIAFVHLPLSSFLFSDTRHAETYRSFPRKNKKPFHYFSIPVPSRNLLSFIYPASCSPRSPVCLLAYKGHSVWLSQPSTVKDDTMIDRAPSQALHGL